MHSPAVGADTPPAQTPPRPGGASTAPFDPEGATLPPSAASPDAADGDVPEAVGGYRLLRPLGEGGMGTVYEAEHTTSGRRVALKLIAADFAASPDAVARFRQEGRLASALTHPRCVFVYAADEEAGRPYIVMELMPGDTLDDLVGRRGPLAVPEAVAKIRDVIDGLEEAHHQGMIHRDVKPSNCFLEADGRVKIGDFGLAKALVRSAHLTKTGSFLGTPRYASPEQIRGQKLDARTDVYSVAGTLYFLVAGQAPHETGDAAATLARIVADDPPSLRGRRPDVPEELDRVIARGLARDRDRRYQDLGEFRQALRPFLPGRSPIVGLGLRFGAYLIDYFFIGLVGGLLGIGGVFAGVAPDLSNPERMAVITPGQVVLQALGFLVFLVYFLPEGLWGYSLGKRMLGLRVQRAASGEPPGLGRGLLRSALFILLLGGGSLAAIVVFASLNVPMHPTPEDQSRMLLRIGVAYVFLLLGTPLGIGLICCTMRPRNGYRGLHDFATGTRVIHLLAPERRLRVCGRTLEEQLSRTDDLPPAIGPYRVKGALRWKAKVSTLLGEDPGLGRDVLLWLRPPSAPPFDAARRGLNRTTRLRWLACGQHGAQQWDAFLAPSGCSLPALVEAGGPLTWPDTRHVLEQLTGELGRAGDEGTLPWSLSTDQVWVQANGRVLLLDAPLTPPPELAGAPSAHSTQPARGEADGDASAEVRSAEELEQRLCLRLLTDAAALALLGRPGSHPAETGRLGIPLPLHAAALLRRFREGKGRSRDVADFRACLRATRSGPAEVTRARRAAHLAVQTAFLFVGLFCCIGPFSIVPDTGGYLTHLAYVSLLREHLDEVERGATRSFLPSALSPDPRVRQVGLGVLGADLHLRDELRQQLEYELARKEARLRSSSALMRPQMEQLEKMFLRGRAQGVARRGPLDVSRGFRQSARQFLDGVHLEQLEAAVTTTALGAIIIWPALWLVWAFLARGGFSFRIVGLALVGRDGRPAPRWRCAWRALLVWAPPTALLAASVWLGDWYWSTWTPADPRFWARWLARVAWWSWLGLLVGYLGLALRSPARALHDRLAGTWIVPR
jgi:hypothetical protein